MPILCHFHRVFVSSRCEALRFFLSSFFRVVRSPPCGIALPFVVCRRSSSATIPFVVFSSVEESAVWYPCPSSCVADGRRCLAPPFYFRRFFRFIALRSKPFFLLFPPNWHQLQLAIPIERLLSLSHQTSCRCQASTAIVSRSSVTGCFISAWPYPNERMGLGHFHFPRFSFASLST
jgi:hypothetical protein